MIADPGPLIALARVERLELLSGLLGEVLVPAAVVAECLADRAKPGARAIETALLSGILIRTPDIDSNLPTFAVLDAVESAAIRLALKLGAMILIDEKAGRKIATNLGLTVIGSAGVLLATKWRGLIDAVRPLLDALAANGYHYSDALVHAILKRAGED